MKIFPAICQIICLFSLVDPATAQSGFFQQITSALSGLGDVVSGVFNGDIGSGPIATFVNNVVDTVVLTVASAVIGQDPEELACELIQGQLAEAPDVTCTCASDITVTTTTAALNGECDIPRTCPVPGVCGVCSAGYNGSGVVGLADQTIDGGALVTGKCDLNEITADIGIAAAVFDFTADLNFAGGFSSLDLSIASCTADFKDPASGATVGVCNCSPCGALEISYTCGGAFEGLSSKGCVSLTTLGGM